MKTNYLSLLFISFLSLLLIAGCATEEKSNIGRIPQSEAPEDIIGASAFDNYFELAQSGNTFVARAIPVESTSMDTTAPPTKGIITFGAEKEASSSLITRIMTPDDEMFKSMVMRLDTSDREIFLRDFLSKWSKDIKGYRNYVDTNGNLIDLSSVTDKDGNVHHIDVMPFKNFNYENSSLEDLDNLFAKWMSQTDKRPLSFVNPTTRRKLYNGLLPGISKVHFANHSLHNFPKWLPLFGDCEKYIENAHNTSAANGKGWELGFVPQKSYGEFEQMIWWFRNQLSVKTPSGKVVLFEAPGHQRMVFPKHPDLDQLRLTELYRVIQAYIVTEGVRGHTGIERASFKKVITDQEFGLGRTTRGVIRIEGDRWGQMQVEGEDGRAHRAIPYETMGIEFRSGTKDPRVQRFVQTALAARVSSNDFTGLVPVNSYTLMDIEPNSLYSELIQDRCNVTDEEAQKFLSVVGQVWETRYRERIFSSEAYLVPLWNWTDKNSPIISDKKKKLIRKLSREFVITVGNLPSEEINSKKIMENVRGWISTSKIYDDLHEYIMPSGYSKFSSQNFHFKPTRAVTVANPVPVNTIDLGIEFSGKMPLRSVGTFTNSALQDDKRHLIGLRADLTDLERRTVLRSVAFDLSNSLGVPLQTGKFQRPKKIKADGHGHGLDIAYIITDREGQEWRVEWDGIGRSYTASGELIPGSARGGSIEIPTPKFNPKPGQIKAVFKAFKKNGIIPYAKTGGGHINIDLAPFDKRPKELARLLAVFLQHRGIIAQMFQHPVRLKAALPINIDPELISALSNFNGTEDELKKLLYDKKYFNDFVGRKTRYTQFDLSSYFQDIIPNEYITEDYDIGNPTEVWRKQFRVEPKIRKGEFRLFDAPHDEYMSGLQIKLVRALLHKALNEEDELPGVVQNISHEEYLKNPQKAFDDLETLGKHLDIDTTEYKKMVTIGFGQTQAWMNSRFYQPLEVRMGIHKKAPTWLKAVDARSSGNAIGSEGRVWNGAPETDAVNYQGLRIAATEEELAIRRSRIDDILRQFTRPSTKECQQAFNRFLGM